MTKFLLHKPVPEGHLGDGFGWRIHPVLHVRKFHEGDDYPAPMGSAVLAGGDGIVERISWEKGYGKFVRIRHDEGYETTYAHLSGTPGSLRIGERVRQGQVIGYVGSTGYSTGPHLYYELRVRGHYVDPLHARLRAGRILSGQDFDGLQREEAYFGSIMKRMGRENMRVAALSCGNMRSFDCSPVPAPTQRPQAVSDVPMAYTDVDRAPQIFNKAFRLRQTGRPVH